MRPELFSIPLVNLSIKSYGFMMVLGFVTALTLARRRSRKAGQKAEHVMNFGVLALLAGVIGARLFHVIHRLGYYLDHPGQVFAIWSGGLEFLGGFILAVIVTFIYFKRHKLAALKYLDIVAPAVMLGLAFGRLGCFLNGCCFGAVCELPWAVRFPVVNTQTQSGPGCEKKMSSYYSHPYSYQIAPDEQRRSGQGALIELPLEYYVQTSEGYELKTPEQLTAQQIHALQHGPHRILPIHPAQLYSSLNAVLICLILCWLSPRLRVEGQLFALMLLLYGATRFMIETLRTDSPLEFDGLTISQNLGVAAVIVGVVLLLRARGKASKPSD